MVASKTVYAHTNVVCIYIIIVIIYYFIIIYYKSCFGTFLIKKIDTEFFSVSIRVNSLIVQKYYSHLPIRIELNKKSNMDYYIPYLNPGGLEMVSLNDYIENHMTISIIDLLKGIDKDRVFIRSHYRSFPKRK
jgi:hypothetical protein